MEADLAFRGIDFRDVYRKGSGLTLRRLLVLIRALPPDSLTHMTLSAEHARSLKPSVETLRARHDYYNAKKREVVSD